MEPLERRELLSVDGLVGTIYSPNPTADTGFGAYVDMIGNETDGYDLVVSSVDSTNPAAYRIDPATGEVVQAYTPPSGTGNNYDIAVLGDNVAMRGSTVINAEGVTDEYIYLFDGNSGDVQQTFVVPDHYNSWGRPQPMVEYHNPDTGQNLLLFGDPMANDRNEDDTGYIYSSGFVRVFDMDSGDLLATIENPTPGNNENFGLGIAVQDDIVYITCGSAETYPDGSGGAWSEAMYAFDASDWKPNAWTVRHAFMKPDDGSGDTGSASSLMLHNNRLYLGSSTDDLGAENAGAVYVFDTWAADGRDSFYVQTWTNPTPEASEGFGYSLAAVNDNILVSAPGDSTSEYRSGMAYLYNSDGQLLRTYLDPTPTESGVFGLDLAVAGDHIAFGDRHDDTMGENSGAVQLFTTDPTTVYVSRAAGLVVSEDGFQVSQTDTFDVVLSAPPTDSDPNDEQPPYVTLNLFVSDPTEATLSDTTLVFDDTNWDIPQTVTITGIDDETSDNDQTFTVDFAPAVSNDPDYNGYQPGSVSVTCLDKMTVNQTFSTGQINLFVPDPKGQTPGYLVSTLDVDVPGTVRDLNLRLDMTHDTFLDLTVYLTSPNGTKVHLAETNRVITSRDPIAGQIFLDDEANVPIGEFYRYPSAGTYTPESALSAFDGEDIQGEWTLEIYDYVRKDTGTLNEWALFDTRYTQTQSQAVPVAADDGYSVDEDGELMVAVSSSVLANDSDADGGPAPLTALLDTAPLHGSVTLSTDGSFTYTPDGDFNGQDSFTYVANDGQDNSNVATVTITVNPVADAPVAMDDAVTTTRDTDVTIYVLANDFDADGDAISVTAFDAESDRGGTIVDSDGTLTYTPASGFTGADTFSYTVTDGMLTDTATVTIDVTEQSVEVRYDSTDTPIQITDAHFRKGDGVVTSTISPVGTFHATAVEISLSHDWALRDLSLTLISPNDNRIGLSVSGNGSTTTVYDLSSYDPSFVTGTGAWTLEVRDTWMGDKGTLDGWALIGESVAQAATPATTDVALLAFFDTDTSAEEDADPLATQAADELALMMME